MKVVLTLETGGAGFPEAQGANTKTIYSASLPGYLHVEANIQRFPEWLANTAVVAIFGMTDDDCFAATKYNITVDRPWYNQIQIFAGYLDNAVQLPDGTYSQDAIISEIDKLPLAFLGEIVSAGADFNDTNRPFIIQANITLQALSVLSQSTSVNNSTSMATVVQNMAAAYNSTNPQIKYQLRSVTPDQIINNTHLNGTFVNQVQQLCNDYGYQLRIINSNQPNTQLLQITKIGNAVTGNTQILSPDNGMIGFPVVLPYGIAVREFYNPNRSLNDLISLQTYYTPLAQNYYVWQMQTFLQTLGDSWETVLTLYGFSNTAQ